MYSTNPGYQSFLVNVKHQGQCIIHNSHTLS